MGVDDAEPWRERSRQNLRAARVLYESGYWHGCANRSYYSYYAAYQAATAVCIDHGDKGMFPNDWNNPTHEQLPDLVRNNGDLKTSVRRQVSTALYFLRVAREDADYRVGRTVDQGVALRCLRSSTVVLLLLGVIQESQEMSK